MYFARLFTLSYVYYPFTYLCSLRLYCMQDLTLRKTRRRKTRRSNSNTAFIAYHFIREALSTKWYPCPSLFTVQSSNADRKAVSLQLHIPLHDRTSMQQHQSLSASERRIITQERPTQCTRADRTHMLKNFCFGEFRN